MPPNYPLRAALSDATQRWHQTITALADDDFAAPSGLPGWSRGHVIAHVALNGEAFLRVLRLGAAEQPASMYDTAEGRDLDIDALASAAPAEIRARAIAVDEAISEALCAFPEQLLDAVAHRLPDGGGFAFALREVPQRRLGEVEIHHADLGLATSSRAAWPVEFSELLLSARTPGHRELRFTATDTDQTWGPDDAPVTLSGSSADLAWWLIGRGTGDGLTSSAGELPPTPTY
ncbi:maleylpyruvate isomerase family mycothiol-dependent enzyme [Nocardioides sp. Bht2]|uniref:maleylpyruvate isomerase family mycothiol-dependent enzyme n=1 Tax=Nocardioides sp. Bht2 TaxID=3392297 RepID=UPI0039B4CB6C